MRSCRSCRAWSRARSGQLPRARGERRAQSACAPHCDPINAVNPRSMAAMTNPIFDSVEWETLRRRRSEKWSKHPPDVLPSFLAEMDFPLAPEISQVLLDAVAE